MKPLIYEVLGKRYEVQVTRTGRYDNGRVALRLIEATTGEHIAVASVNLPKRPCPEGEVWIKDYAENVGMRDWLIKHRIIERESEAVVVLPFGNVVSRHRLIPSERARGPLDTCAQHRSVKEEGK